MKITKLITLCTLATFSLLINSNVKATEITTKREIYNANKGAVYGVKAILKITATINGQLQKQEAKIWSNATCISERLLVASHSSISPNLGGAIPNANITKEIEDLKIVNEAGIEFDAKLVLHDEDLGLAFIALDPKGKNAANWKSSIIDISKDIPLKHLDETVNISRYAAHFNYQSAATIGSVSAIIEKPRKFYQIINASMSAPSFNTEGHFVGITSTKEAAVGKAPTPVTIPAKYIRKLAARAKALQANL